MKKAILTVAAIFAFGFANAQDKKESKGEGFANGDIFISGAVGFGSEKGPEARFGAGGKTNSFMIAPKVGLFVTDNIAIGAKLGYTSDKAENTAGAETQDDSTLSVGVFGRYYCTPNSKFNIFGNLGFDYWTTNHNIPTPDYKTNGFDLALSPGVSYFLNSNFAMEASFGRLGYMTSKDDTDGAEATNSFGLELDLRSITFGLVYKF